MGSKYSPLSIHSLLQDGSAVPTLSLFPTLNLGWFCDSLSPADAAEVMEPIPRLDFKKPGKISIHSLGNLPITQ